MKIAFVASEVFPFSKTGGLADVAGSLPVNLKRLGCDIRVFSPLYKEVKNSVFDIPILKEDLTADLGVWDKGFSLRHTARKGVDFYFIDKDEYYNRNALYNSVRGDYPDNPQRFAFFSNAVLASMKDIGFKPDIIHLNDWQTAMIPFYLRNRMNDDDFFKDTRTIFTIHNLAFQGVFPRRVISSLGIERKFFTMNSLEFHGKLSFIKAGITYSDALSTVSDGYAREILTPAFGCGLDRLLYARRDDLYGILNGADYSRWNPETDDLLESRYSAGTIKDKSLCKHDLLNRLGLADDAEAPILGVISRLTHQKGIDLIISSVKQLLKLGCKLAVLGEGYEGYQRKFTDLAQKFPDRISVTIGFDDVLAHRIEAGSDIFLMPSRFEPCGLNQLYSLKYGTVPVVRAVGGLDDTIVDYTTNKKTGNGFKFIHPNKDEFVEAIQRAVTVYRNRKEWVALIERIMGLDYSWKRSAQRYLRMYKMIGEEK